MSEDKLERGDVVQLKSGGPRMTIARIFQDGRGTLATCNWMTQGAVEQKMEADFIYETLKYYNPRRDF